VELEGKGRISGGTEQGGNAVILKAIALALDDPKK